MTFSNRREPTFGSAPSAPPEAPQTGPHVAPADQLAHKVAKASGLTRMVSSVQIVGSLLAVPLGLASGYSMYKANFAVDTTCQNLRANIVTMLDKNVDASTRRMLVRRDITTFEQTCGSFDPDAHAAFKALLAVPDAPVAAAAAPKLRPAVPAAEVARKVEPKVEVKPEPRHVAEKPVAAPAPASIATIEREAAVSDARWLDAVRQALVTNPEPATPVKGSAPANLEVPAAKPAKAEAKPEPKPETIAVAKPAAPAVSLQPTWTVAPQPPAPVAAAPAPVATPEVAPAVTTAPPLSEPAAVPALATPVPAVEAPQQAAAVRDDAPRPPAAITGPKPINGEVGAADDSGKSRIGSWIAHIPLVGRVIEPRE
ncbi:MAG: hypothetical protein Q7T81_13410 [Pseudolabrys sp.]|nr:hypothetical protein [Pseudolabrys sp.]